ncbi:hypothetical protein [Streptomyces globosus]|uniref:hypothetical protein n=1 Tax=Streptomyces globosus TaxID=68209 RepID=UPI0031CF9045
MNSKPLRTTAEAAIAALAELTGMTPEITSHEGHLTARADASLVPAAQWQRLVAVLETGTTSFGMTTTAAGKKSVWLRIQLGEQPR